MEQLIYLIRYGQVPEVARALASESLSCERGQTVMLRSDRGLQAAVVLDLLSTKADSRVRDGLAEEVSFEIVRCAQADDLSAIETQDSERIGLCALWQTRIRDWQLNIELLDIELTHDAAPKTILYVLNDRGAETTRLALLAAAAGHGVIEVQPVTASGLAPIARGGCGSGGCGSKH